MKREKRYIIFKVTDAEKHLNDPELNVLKQLERKVAAGRLSDKKPLMTAVVVEEDWPEYERTWQSIEARVGG